jgi:hypothetical protein
MANEKISQMPLISTFASGDLFPIVDISEASAADRNKSVTFGELFRNVLGGSASDPSIAFTGDQNTGIYSPGADQVAVATNGQGRLFVDASGNVGVGTSSVNALLEVNNSTAGGEVQRIEGNYSGSGSVILTNWRRAGGSVAAALKYNDDSSPLCMSIGTTTSHEFRIRTADTDAITIDTSQRVGVGTTTPGSYETSANNLVVADSGNGGITIATGTSSYGSIYFADGTTATDKYRGVIEYNHSNNAMAFWTDATERARIDSSGRLGIGTSSPSSTAGGLDISSGGIGLVVGADGSTVTRTNSTDKIFRIGSYHYTNAEEPVCIAFGQNLSSDNELNFGGGSAALNAATYIRFFTAANNTTTTGTERVRIDNAGRVGIGVTSPGEKLSIYDSTSNAFISIQNGSTGTTGSDGSFIGVAGTSLQIGNRESASVDFYTTNTERARIDSSGRLLVGTSSTSKDFRAVFQGNSADATGGANLLLARGTSSPADGSAIGYLSFTDSNHNTTAQIQAQRDGGTWTSGTSQPGRLVFSTTADGASSPTERMRINNEGTVHSLGYTDGAAVNAWRFRQAGSSTITLSMIETIVSSTTTRYHYTFRNGALSGNASGAIVGSISTSGSATSFTTSSDYRLKENVVAVTDGITRLQQLKPSRFNFIVDPDKTVDGFLAHEAQAVVPECITGTKDEVDDDGNPVYQGIDQSKLVPLLTAALQEAIGEIESLKARVAALESA